MNPYLDNWLTYHGNYWRTGTESGGLSTFGYASRAWSSQTLDGMIYAEPLVANHTIYAATEGDSVYALSEQSGEVLWKVSLGQPVSVSSTGLPSSCWTIDPIGITSTPAIDPNSGTLYAVGFVSPGQFLLEAIDASNGQQLWNRVIDPPGMNPLTQQQRAALAIANGYVYIGFGGNGGDCGRYNGYLVAAPENGSGSLLSFEVPTTNGGPIWGPSGPAVDNSTGDIFISTGNSNSTDPSNFDYGNSVIKLSPTLQVLGYFAPSDWTTLNAGDLDLGSVGPTILNQNLVFQVGKEGVGYLIQIGDMGGISDGAYSGPICWQGSESTFTGGAYGGVAYDSPFLYVPCLTNGIIAIQLDLGSSPSFWRVWNSTGFFAGAPIVADGAVWTVDIGGTYLGQNGTLFALNPRTGSIMYSASIGEVGHFITPSADANMIFVGGNETIQAFTAS